jgi:negative regulator of flagellin synthesis FlgM
LNQVQKKGSEAPVNQEKVDRLKKAISSGEYKVNPEVLANKIAKLEGEIFGQK